MKKIMKRPEIAKQVMERYPLTKLEKRGCTIEKCFRDAMRFEYAKKLIQVEGKAEYDPQPANKAI